MTLIVYLVPSFLTLQSKTDKNKQTNKTEYLLNYAAVFSFKEVLFYRSLTARKYSR